MRAVRLMLALLLSAGLALLPVAAATAMAGATKAEMHMSGHDCPCCPAAQPEGAKPDACPFACCHVSAITIESVAIRRPVATLYAVPDGAAVTAVSRQPEPPPPRA